MDEKTRLLEDIRDAGKVRKAAKAMIAVANCDLRRLAPAARDHGATVDEIADAYGVSRPGVYVLMANPGEAVPVNGDPRDLDPQALEAAYAELSALDSEVDGARG
jgi:hypothetical protein